MKQKRKSRKVAQQWGRKMLIAIVSMLVVSAANAQKPKLAVMDFTAGVGLYQNDVNGLSDMLINSLFNTGRFELIERGQLSELIGETNLQKSSLSAGQLQQLAIKGVNFLLLGTVNLTGGEYNVDVRVVDVGTGQLYSTAGVTKFSTQTYRDMMPKLANELAEKLPQIVNTTVTVRSVSEKSKEPDVIILLGYLKVYPDDIGEFSSKPTTIIANINKQELHGHNTWRLPSQEELDLMKANSNKLGLKNGEYMTSNGRAGNVRLVTTGEIEREEVLINGIRWATCNVGYPGTFVSNSEDYGRFYSWDEAQNVCPKGWRLPSIIELESLVNAGSSWATQNGINGRKFGSISNNIFLPAAGDSYNEGIGTYGIYWSSTVSGSLGGPYLFERHAHYLGFNSNSSNASTEAHLAKVSKFCVRCVVE